MSPLNTHRPCTQNTHPYVTITLNTCSISPPRRARRTVAECAPGLLTLPPDTIPLPSCTHTHDAPPIMLSAVGPHVHVLGAKTRPKKIILLGNDGQEYAYLLKGHEDLHRDAAVVQIIYFVNAALTEHHRPPAPCMPAVCITPLGQDTGLVAWVEESVPLYRLYRSAQTAAAAGGGGGSGKGVHPLGGGGVPPVPQQQGTDNEEDGDRKDDGDSEKITDHDAEEKINDKEIKGTTAAAAGTTTSSSAVVAQSKSKETKSHPPNTKGGDTRVQDNTPPPTTTTTKQHRTVQQHPSVAECFYSALLPALKAAGLSTTTPRTQWPLPVLREVLGRLGATNTPSGLVAKALWLDAGGAGDWWGRVQRYTSSLAAGCMVGGGGVRGCTMYYVGGGGE